jgi:hypothetical protein
MYDTSNQKLSARVTRKPKQLDVKELATRLSLPIEDLFLTSHKLYEYHMIPTANRLDVILEFLAKEPSSTLLVHPTRLPYLRYRARQLFGEAQEKWASELNEYNKRIELEDAPSDDKWQSAMNTLVELQSKLSADWTSDQASDTSELASDASELPSNPDSEDSNPTSEDSNPTSSPEAALRAELEAQDGLLDTTALDVSWIQTRDITIYHEKTVEYEEPIYHPWYESQILPIGSHTSASFVFLEHELEPYIIVYTFRNGLPSVPISELRDHFSVYVKSYHVEGIDGSSINMEIDYDVLATVLYNGIVNNKYIYENDKAIVVYGESEQLDNLLGNTVNTANVILLSVYRRMLIDPLEKFHSYSDNIKCIYMESLDYFNLGRITVRKLEDKPSEELAEYCSHRSRKKRWTIFHIPSLKKLSHTRKLLLKFMNNDSEKVDEFLFKYIRKSACLQLLKFWRPLGTDYRDDIDLYVVPSDFTMSAENIIAHSILSGFATIEFRSVREKEIVDYKQLARDLLAVPKTKMERMLSACVIYLIHKGIYYLSPSSFRKYAGGRTNNSEIQQRFISTEDFYELTRKWVDDFENGQEIFQEAAYIPHMIDEGLARFKPAFREAVKDVYSIGEDENLAASDINLSDFSFA